jgi:hypothetical protein
VLTGIGRPSRWPELSATRVAATVELCRSWVEFTVIDTGFNLEHDEEISTDLFAPRRNAASITALREADRVVAVGSADPVGLSRFLRAHVDLVETVAEGRVIVAMNKVRASAIGLNPIGQVTQTLSRFGGIESARDDPVRRAGAGCCHPERADPRRRRAQVCCSGSHPRSGHLAHLSTRPAQAQSREGRPLVLKRRREGRHAAPHDADTLRS